MGGPVRTEPIGKYRYHVRTLIRFNPPHQGHLAAWKEAAKNPDYYVGTNQSTAGKKDPLPYEIKVKAMTALMPELRDHIVPEQNLFTLASKVYDRHGEDVNLTVYTDEDWLIKGLKKYNGEEGKHGYYKFAKIQQKPTPRLSSATALRNAVASGDRAGFAKAAGVPENFTVDSVNYFDLVSEYLTPYLKEAKTDKYYSNRLEESEMNELNRLRKLAGMPIMEGPAVNYYGDSDRIALVRRMGRALMNAAESEKDDVESGRMSKVGSALAEIDAKQPDPLKAVLARIKLDDPQVLNRYLNMGMDLVKQGMDDISHTTANSVSNRNAQAGDNDDDFAADDEATMNAVDDMEDDDFEESLDLSDIVEEYELDEADDGTFLMDMLASFEDMCSQQGYYGDVDANAVKRQLDAGNHEAAAEEMASAISDRRGGEAPDEVYQQALEMVQDYMAEHGDMGSEMARYESADDFDLAGLGEAAKPDYIDLDDDGDTDEPMKKAAKDAEEVDESVVDMDTLRKLADYKEYTMNEMRKLINIMESAIAEKSPPQSGTREYENMHRALSELGNLRRAVADSYNRYPKWSTEEQVSFLNAIRKALRWPMSILNRMEIDQSGWEFRLANKPWGILASRNANFEDLVNNTEPTKIQGMFKLMDKDLANLVNKLSPDAGAEKFIN